jgi:AraC-like DNA-binding protein
VKLFIASSHCQPNLAMGTIRCDTKMRNVLNVRARIAQKIRRVKYRRVAASARRAWHGHAARHSFSKSAWYCLQLTTRHLENPSASLAQVATEVGYESEAAFNRAFKKHVGAPPGMWRRGRMPSVKH